MAKQQQQQSHPIADQFSDEEMEAIKRYGQALGGNTAFSEEVEKALPFYEAHYAKMRAAATGGSLELGPSQAETQQVKQRQAIGQRAATQQQVQASQAQGAQAPVSAPEAPSGPQGVTVSEPAQARQQPAPDVTAAPPGEQGQPPAAPGPQTGAGP